jgi:hypothetical protein
MGHLAVVSSNRGGEGKTLLTHLLTEYLVEMSAPWTVYTSSPRAAAGPLLDNVAPLDVGSTLEQVRFVDDVLRAPDAWTILDLSHADNARFLEFCDVTGAVGELKALGVETWSLRVYAASVREVKATFWPQSLVDAREVLVLNHLSPTQLAEWRANPYRAELADAGVPEITLPRMDDGAVAHFLGRRAHLHDYLVDRGGAGVDVFARVQLAKLVHAFHAQFRQVLLAQDLARLNAPLFQ